MKYLISLIFGLMVGAALFAMGLLYNPFFVDRALSPLTVTDAEVIVLNYSKVPAESIAYTNDGESLHAPHPENVLQLWEASISMTSAMATVLRDARGQVAGVGIKFSSNSESTNLLHGQALANSVWYIYLPEQGSMFMHQSENYWPFFREVAFPAWRSSANNWRGTWLSDMTVGPGALGIAAVSGGSGRFRGLEMNGLESMSVRAFSADTGLISAQGRLIIEIPEPEAYWEEETYPEDEASSP
jgi:hypothetical protein